MRGFGSSKSQHNSTRPGPEVSSVLTCQMSRDTALRTLTQMWGHVTQWCSLFRCSRELECDWTSLSRCPPRRVPCGNSYQQRTHWAGPIHSSCGESDITTTGSGKVVCTHAYCCLCRMCSHIVLHMFLECTTPIPWLSRHFQIMKTVNGKTVKVSNYHWEPN